MHRTRGHLAVHAKKIVIKKYANRRLYDTSGSRYINLEDIAARVRNGKDLQVVDAKTGEDLTRVTLTQIIVEDAKGQPTGLPLELLRQLIEALHAPTATERQRACACKTNGPRASRWLWPVWHS